MSDTNPARDADAIDPDTNMSPRRAATAFGVRFGVSPERILESELLCGSLMAHLKLGEMVGEDITLERWHASHTSPSLPNAEELAKILHAAHLRNILSSDRRGELARFILAEIASPRPKARIAAKEGPQ